MVRPARLRTGGNSITLGSIWGYIPLTNLALWAIYNGSDIRGGVFVAQRTAALNRVITTSQKFGTPTGNAECRIYNAAGTVLLGTSDVVDVSGLATSLAAVNFDFATPVNVSNGVSYVVSWWMENGVNDSSNYFGVASRTTAEAWPSGSSVIQLRGSPSTTHLCKNLAQAV